MDTPGLCPDDARLQAFVAGTLAAAARAAVEAHLDGCESCHSVVAALIKLPVTEGNEATELAEHGEVATEPGGPAAPAPRLQRGATVGRYLVLQRLGAGGMGVVYAAFDPELDRKVALKLVRPEPSRERGHTQARQARLLREAQAMAKLSHPNVIAVHDVGSYEDQVFVAMELVQGTTLSKWRESERRSLHEILDAFLQAGRGLAACHEAGLVHRDFKPGNVLVGKEGRVRVLDFGLAHLDDPEPTADPSSGASPPMLTHTGAFMGTPAYMSPEQRERRSADARSDQYSFCVALYEALSGARPDGAARSARSVRGAPAWVARVLARGLREDPEQRYPDMGALLADLERDPTARRRGLVAAAVALVLVGLGAVGVRGLIVQRRMLCHGGAQKLLRVWDAGRRSELLARADALGGGYATDALRGAADLLDRYAAGWEKMHVDACEATNVRGEQSAQFLDLRMRCLDTKLAELDAVAAELIARDGTPVFRAVPLAASLPSVRECADGARLQSRSVTKDPRLSETLGHRLAESRALAGSGRFAEARDRVAPIPEQARAIGDEVLATSAFATLARVKSELDDDQGANDALLSGLLAAEYAGDPFLLVAMRQNYAIHLESTNHPRESLIWLDMAQAALDGRGGDPLLEAKILNARAAALQHLDRGAEAKVLHERALDLRTRALGPRSVEVGWSRMNYGGVLTELGENERGLREKLEAYDILSHEVGLAHPDVMALEANIGHSYLELERYAEAREWLDRALAHELAAFGPDASRVQHAQHLLGILLRDTGHFAEAMAKEEEVLRILAARGKSDDAEAGFPLIAIGRMQLQQERPHEAALTFDRALKLPPRDIPSKAEVKYGLGRALYESGDDRSRGLRLVNEAKAGFQDGSPASKKVLDEIDDWEKKHVLALR